MEWVVVLVLVLLILEYILRQLQNHANSVGRADLCPPRRREVKLRRDIPEHLAH